MSSLGEMLSYHYERSVKIDIVHCEGKSIFYSLGQYYSQFGEIANIRVIDDYVSTIGFGVGFIQFVNGYIAQAKILKNKKLQIMVVPEYGQPCERELVNDFSKELRLGEEIDIAESESSSNILNTLNDDCLQEIFRHLPLDDLCSVADVCVQFKANAKAIYPTKFADSMLLSYEVWRLESLLRNFGAKVKALNFSNIAEIIMSKWCTSNPLILLLVKYCTDDECQLQKMTFDHEILEYWYELLTPIIKRLSHLSTSNCLVDGILIRCERLTELNLGNDRAPKLMSIPAEVFSRLETLSISYSDDFEDIVGLMQPNIRLKTLKLKGWKRMNINEIAFKFPNLEEFVLCHNSGGYAGIPLVRPEFHHFVSLRPWKQLKRVGFAHYGDPVVASEFISLLVDAKVPVESLKLYNDLRNYNFLAGLTELKTLIIKCSFDFDLSYITSIVMYAERLTLLIFKFFSQFNCNTADFDELLATVKRRKNSEKLLVKMISVNVFDADKLKEKLSDHHEFLEFEFI